MEYWKNRDILYVLLAIRYSINMENIHVTNNYPCFMSDYWPQVNKIQINDINFRKHDIFNNVKFREVANKFKVYKTVFTDA